jgi:hypothetical protein
MSEDGGTARGDGLSSALDGGAALGRVGADETAADRDAVDPGPFHHFYAELVHPYTFRPLARPSPHRRAGGEGGAVRGDDSRLGHADAVAGLPEVGRSGVPDGRDVRGADAAADDAAEHADAGDVSALRVGDAGRDVPLRADADERAAGLPAADDRLSVLSAVRKLLGEVTP